MRDSVADARLLPEVPNLMRITDLKGRPVVDKVVARTLGRIVDATGARIVAVDVAASGPNDCVRIPAEWIIRIGRCAVMVARRSGGGLAEAVAASERFLNYQSLVGLEVLDENGELMLLRGRPAAVPTSHVLLNE
jgi:hypothetical protein